MSNDRADDPTNDRYDLAELVRSVVTEGDPEVTKAQIEATLADSAFAALAARTLSAYEGILTPEALDTARLTLAVVFIGDPQAAALLARVRAGEPRDASATRPGRGAPTTRKRRAKP